MPNDNTPRPPWADLAELVTPRIPERHELSAEQLARNAEWDRAEAALSMRLDAEYIADDSGPYDSDPYDGTIGIGGAP